MVEIEMTKIKIAEIEMTEIKTAEIKITKIKLGRHISIHFYQLKSEI